MSIGRQNTFISASGAHALEARSAPVLENYVFRRLLAASSLVAFGLLALTPASAAEPQPAFAMYGAPKYADGFTHFDYVNTAAPKGGTLRLSAIGSFDSLNPFIVLGRPALGLDTGFLALLYEPLMARSQDEPFSLYGLIAQSVDVPDDRSSITFNLNPAAHWSDGLPITADDVLFSFQTLRDKGRPNHRNFYKKVDKAERLDDRHVRFTFLPNADGTINREMPLIMALMPVLPQHDWVDRDFSRTSLRVPVGSGPYKITAVDPGRSITYTRDPHYWGRDLPVERGMHNFDDIRIDYYRDNNIALEAFKAGQFDLRIENDVDKWTMSYDFPAAHDGRVKVERLPHHRTEPATGFIFNTRRAPFDDPALRAALEYSFDSAWINRNLFHGQYHRATSFFPNSELAAPPLPDLAELALLDKFRGQISASVFTSPVTPPDTDGSEESLRANLLKASAMLRDAGYALRDDILYSPDGRSPIAFEILLNDPTEEKVALVWTRTLKRLGIQANVKLVDSAQYQARMAGFDFAVTTSNPKTVAKWVNSLSPGNEQINFWGSAAADQKGSRNYPGVKSAVVDALAASIPAAHSRQELVTAVHALDRVLMAGHYTIPFYYLGADDIAYWSRLRHPDALPANGTVLESWWADPAAKSQ